ncbi:MAG: hypothetical protein IJD45_03985, partial [Clostridia bacterium]|nr:hypothetical protein [Clostridia bacterium]
FGSPFMVSGQFHFNGFLPNMLYFFISISIFLRRLYLVTPTFIIEPLFIFIWDLILWFTLLRCPKVVFGLERRQLSTAALCFARFIVHRTRSQPHPSLAP